VAIDDEQGIAECRCVSCATSFVMRDSADVLDEADLSEAACPCGNESFEVTSALRCG
jgi:hypothetical protein